MTPDLPTVLLAKSLDKRLTSHPGWEGFIEVNIVFFRREEIECHFILAWPLRIQGY